jgi:hypothetical protein
MMLLEWLLARSIAICIKHVNIIDKLVKIELGFRFIFVRQNAKIWPVVFSDNHI